MTLHSTLPTGWQGVREHRESVWIGREVIALGRYGFVATLQPDAHFGRILDAYDGVASLRSGLARAIIAAHQ